MTKRTQPRYAFAMPGSGFDVLNVILQVVLAYLIGTIMGGQIVGALRGGIDLRQHGSGNLGATNALRTQGKSFALAVLAIDVLKGIAASLLLPMLMVFPESALSEEQRAYLCGVAVALGHCYPVFAGFRGGKGVATLAGVFGALLTPSLPWLLVGFVVVTVLSGYVSLATVVATLIAVLYVACWTDAGIWSDTGVFTLAVSALVIWKHRDNIRRLAAGNEHRFTKAQVWRRWLSR